MGRRGRNFRPLFSVFSKVQASMSHAEIERISPLLTDLVGIGFFRLSGVDTDLSTDELVDLADALAGGLLREVGDGWYVTDWPETLAVQTIRRIAGVVSYPVPCSDVVEALMKAIAFGPAAVALKERRARASEWIEAYEAIPGASVLAELASITGARIISGRGVNMMDFFDVTDPMEPTEEEALVLYALQESPFAAMQLSRLCRRLPGSPSRTATYAMVERMPFILKDHTKAARIIGFEGHPEGFVPEKVEFFRGLCWSEDGRRALLELSANDECIQSNSCNIPEDARIMIEGIYREVQSGIELRCNHRNGPDKRKVAGLPQIIKRQFRDYVAKDRIYVLLDRDTGEARVDVFSIHRNDKLASIMRMLQEGIRHGDLLEMFDDALNEAA